MTTLLVIFAIIGISAMILNSIYGCGQRCYRTKIHAYESARFDQRPYFCEECERWHLENIEENS